MFKKLFFVAFLVTFFNSYSQNLDPLRTDDYYAQEKWVDSILNSMTIDQKMGQLFMIQAYSNLDTVHENKIKEMIQKYHVGNLIFMQGTPSKQVQLTNTYQSLSKIPLMIGFDGEWGLDMRLQNTYKFPWNMTLGAIQDNTLIRKFGEHLGRHAKRVGIHVNFAPVVDINTNPLNPIIGNRSFGEDKQNVTQKAIAFSQGMQSEGVLANAKHFPGHGDTATDSHLKLPVLTFDRQRLDSVELYPYKRVFDAGMASVMTAHLSIPVLESNPKLPTSLSPSVVTDLLKEELGFLGLIFTDGLNMKGAADYSSSAEIDLAAVLAGNDVLLIPQDVPATISLMKNSIQTGVLSPERIDESVRKILLAKYKVGLHFHKPIDTLNLVKDLNTIEDEVLHRELVKNSITIIKNKKNILPIEDLKKHKKIAYVALGDDTGDQFLDALAKYSKIHKVDSNNLNEVIDTLEDFDLVVVGFHKSNAHPWKPYEFSNQELVWLHEIARKNKTILAVFASPYSLLNIKSFTNLEAVLVAYQNSEIAQEITAQTIFGAIEATGKLPVSIKNEFPVGTGIITKSLQRLQYSIPEAVGMSSKKLARIDSVATVVLEEKMSPGLQVLVARKGVVVYEKSFGYHTDKKKNPVKNSDVYDVASLTKILASLPMLIKAEEEKKIALSSSVRKIVPRFKKSNKDTVTVQEILSHYGQLKAWIPFYKLTQDSITNKNLKKFYRAKKTKKFTIKVAEDLFLNSSYKDSIYKYIRDAEQREKPGYKYSDLGYYIFKEALEKRYKKDLNVLVDDEFYEPLGANRMSYLPLAKFDKLSIVPSEKDSYFRHQLLHGYVHDMGAAMLGGVGGHAGLFANSNDVAKMMQLYLQKGYYGGKRYFKAATFDKFNKRYYSDKKVRRGLGFDKPQLDSTIMATCGCVSDESFGHSGFTGAYTWADPVSGILYVFLSNRVFPTMENYGLVDQDIRTKIQQIIQEAILQN
ncbi:serine hydrolase [Flavobacteriaceae bacterium]|jgi:beta-glucosidase-like glycosyl hydrolase/CubicO group peptidase (beta-lactamase class C family)|nr:serine hydrolase [Flavobacteriaceae bacterium]MDB9781261.1 serine hydrolase [Flavobacteriaceae bacterium]|tara:strand:+ start:1039 stop:3963 length:2925 start_codon:yes stop_codon:yes gene_type:complete